MGCCQNSPITKRADLEMLAYMSKFLQATKPQNTSFNTARFGIFYRDLAPNKIPWFVNVKCLFMMTVLHAGEE